MRSQPKKINMRHGHYKGNRPSPTYCTWQAMRQRCSNPKSPDWAVYGGRGIKVCERWMNSFPKFLSDMGERPEGCSLDRIDVDGDYCKENCRWATPKEQALNMRTTHLIKYNGEVDSMNGWSKKLGVTWQTVEYNYKHGLPLGHRRRPEKNKKYNGKTLYEWAEWFGVKYVTLASYVKTHGIDKAITFYGGKQAL